MQSAVEQGRHDLCPINMESTNIQLVLSIQKDPTPLEKGQHTRTKELRVKKKQTSSCKSQRLHRLKMSVSNLTAYSNET